MIGSSKEQTPSRCLEALYEKEVKERLLLHLFFYRSPSEARANPLS